MGAKKGTREAITPEQELLNIATRTIQRTNRGRAFVTCPTCKETAIVEQEGYRIAASCTGCGMEVGMWKDQ